MLFRSDPGWAATLPAVLESAGLVDRGSLRDRMTFTGGSPLAEFFRLTLQQFAEGIPYSEAERTVIEAGRAALALPGGPYLAWDFLSAWGRRP